MLGNLVIVQSTGQLGPLDEDSLLCFADRQILGKVFETFGQVSRPMYSVRFNNASDIDREHAVKGAKILCVPDKAKFVSVGRLKTEKGSDASNCFDEEPADDELEFSDDEKEREHKLALKQKRRKTRGGGSAGVDGAPPSRPNKKPRRPAAEPVYTPLPPASTVPASLPRAPVPRPANPFLTAPPHITPHHVPPKNPLVLPLPQPRVLPPPQFPGPQAAYQPIPVQQQQLQQSQQPPQQPVQQPYYYPYSQVSPTLAAAAATVPYHQYPPSSQQAPGGYPGMDSQSYPNQ